MRVRAPFIIMEWKDKCVPVRRKPFIWSVYALGYSPWHSEGMTHLSLIHVLRVSRRGITER